MQSVTHQSTLLRAFIGTLMTPHITSSEELSAQGLHTRFAKAQDLANIVSLINYAFLDENPYLLRDRVDFEEIRGLMKKGSFLLVEEAGKIIALIYAEILGQGRGYLGLLVVDPTRRRDGVGKQLLLDGEDFCRQYGCRLVEGTVIN
jgi:N-acetylglutamate synthase-like GNAT family acetyltransferase